jgi:hypothetical protein
MTDNLANVIDFFLQEIKIKVKPEDKIYHDLGLFGLDADCVLMDFERKFNINLENVDFSEYILDEMGLVYFYYKFFKPDKLVKKPLTVRHLAEVVDKGYWFYPSNNNNRKTE